MCCTYRLDQRWYRDTVALCFPYGMQRAFCCFKWIQPLPGGLLQREKLYLLMFPRNLFVPDFVRRFFVSCAQISEAYVDEIRVRLAENRPQRQVQERLREDINSFRSPLNIQVLNFLCILGNEITSWLYLITHKSGKGKVYF